MKGLWLSILVIASVCLISACSNNKQVENSIAKKNAIEQDPYTLEQVENSVAKESAIEQGPYTLKDDAEPEEGWSTEKGDFPQCQRGLKLMRSGRIMGRSTTTWKEFGCAFDALYKRNCKEIRLEGELRVKLTPSHYECVEGEPLHLSRKQNPDSPKEWKDFSKIWRKGDCSDVIANYRSRIRTVIRRLECNDEGRVFEDYHCWGCAEGGRTYNPCGGGSC